MTKSEIFKKSWVIARETRNQHATLRIAFAAALRATYASVKKPVVMPVSSILFSRKSVAAAHAEAEVRIARRRVARET